MPGTVPHFMYVCVCVYCCLFSVVLFSDFCSPFEHCVSVFPASSDTTSCGIQMQTVRWQRDSRGWLSVVGGVREAT